MKTGISKRAARGQPGETAADNCDGLQLWSLRGKLLGRILIVQIPSAPESAHSPRKSGSCSFPEESCNAEQKSAGKHFELFSEDGCRFPPVPRARRGCLLRSAPSAISQNRNNAWLARPRTRAPTLTPPHFRSNFLEQAVRAKPRSG